MNITKVWWFWFKKSWRLIVLSLALAIVEKPFGFIYTIVEKSCQKLPYVALGIVIVLVLVALPVFTYAFTLLVSTLWKPKDIYEWYK